MNLMYRFLGRYPLVIEGILFLAGQLAVAILIVSSGWQHFEVTSLSILCAAILIFLLIIKGIFVQITIFTFAIVLGLYSQLTALPSDVNDFHIPRNIRGHFYVIDNPKRKVPQKVSFTALPRNTLQNSTKLRISAVELPWRNVSGIRKGDSFKALLKCRPIKTPSSIFSYQYLLLRRGISADCSVVLLNPYWTKKRNPTFIENLRTQLPDTHAYRLEYGLLLSLIFGIDSEIPTQLEKSFKRTGLTHLLVFSGAQTSIIYLTIAFILRILFSIINRSFYFGYSGLVEVIIAFIGTVSFCAVIGFESSTMRAVIASGLVVFSSIKETNQGMLYRMFLSLVILSSIWPGCFLEPGVQLTYAALVGIWYGLQYQNKIASYLNMSLGISLLTNFVSLLWFGSISFAGIILNPLIAPVVSVFSVYCGIPAVFLIHTQSEICLKIATVVLWCLAWLESFVFWVSRFEWAYYNWNQSY